MAIPLLPSKLAPWCGGFLDCLTNAPSDYQLDPSDLIPLTEATQSFLNAQSAVANPNARTGALIRSRDDAQKAYYQVARPMYAMIYVNPQITNQHKVAAGVHVKGAPTSVPIPSEVPRIDFVSLAGRSVKARVHGTTTGRRGRPSGCSGAYVWSFVGEVAPGDLREWSFWGTSTKTVFEVEFPSSVQGGSKVWLCAAWINTKGQLGPVCDPVGTHLLFGGVSVGSARVMKAA